MGLFQAFFKTNARIFDFEIVSFPYLDGDIPRRAFYGVFISQLMRFARLSTLEINF